MPVQFKDYYETLGVSKTATPDEVRKAFRKLARQYHPDVAKDKKTAEAKFKEINEAYEVLSDPEKRQKYDTLGVDWERGGPPPRRSAGFGGVGEGNGETEFHFGGTGFSDFFEQFFGGGGVQRNPFGGGFSGGFGGRETSRRGHDIEADIMVTIEEALRGSKRQVSFRRSENADTETYNVRIPAGVHEGQRIRLAGQGGKGAHGGSAGDLFLRVKFAQHPDFHVENGEMIYELDLTPAQAVLGTAVNVHTLEGDVKLKVPAGTQHGQRFRLKQRGLPQPGGVRGDLYVMAQIEIPKELSASARQLWEQLARIE